jgi:hypothetical protein
MKERHAEHVAHQAATKHLYRSANQIYFGNEAVEMLRLRSASLSMTIN